MTRPMTSAPLTPPEQALEALFSARAQRMPEDSLRVAAVLARATTLRRRRTAYRSSVALVAILAAVPLGTDLAHAQLAAGVGQRRGRPEVDWKLAAHQFDRAAVDLGVGDAGSLLSC